MAYPGPREISARALELNQPLLTMYAYAAKNAALTDEPGDVQGFQAEALLYAANIRGAGKPGVGGANMLGYLQANGRYPSAAEMDAYLATAGRAGQAPGYGYPPGSGGIGSTSTKAGGGTPTGNATGATSPSDYTQLETAGGSQGGQTGQPAIPPETETGNLTERFSSFAREPAGMLVLAVLAFGLLSGGRSRRR